MFGSNPIASPAAGVLLAFVIGWVAFRILYVVDQHFGGLPRLLGRYHRVVLFGAPVAAAIAWLVYWGVRLR